MSKVLPTAVSSCACGTDVHAFTFLAADAGVSAAPIVRMVTATPSVAALASGHAKSRRVELMPRSV